MFRLRCTGGTYINDPSKWQLILQFLDCDCRLCLTSKVFGSVELIKRYDAIEVRPTPPNDLIDSAEMLFFADLVEKLLSSLRTL